MRTRRTSVLVGLAVAGVIGAGLSCSDSTGPSVSSVALGLGGDSLFYGRSITASVTALGDSAAIASADSTWTSSDTSVAVVDSTGVILGIGIGQATISVKLGGKVASKVLRVVLQRTDGGVGFADGSYQYSAQCAVTAAGSVYCRRKEPGTDSLQQYAKMPGAAGIVFTSIHTGLDSQCGLSTTQQIYCWGRNGHWSFGTSRFIPTDTGPAAVLTGAFRFSAMTNGGHSQICGISKADSAVYCWGHNDLNQLGRLPLTGQDSVPTPVTGGLRARFVATANGATCALDLTGVAYCWGYNAGAIGVAPGGNVAVPTPQPVVGGMTFASIVPGENNVCALTTGGDAYCWGANTEGQLGIGSTLAAPDIGPQRVLGGLKFTSLAMSNSAGRCGITTDHDLYCWGKFMPELISTHIDTRRTTPYQIAKGVKFQALSTELKETCAIAANGQALCW